MKNIKQKINNKEYEDALVLIDNYLLKKYDDIIAIKLKLKCLIETKRIKEALNMLIDLKEDQKFDVDILKAFFKCFYELKDYGNLIDIFFKLCNFERNIDKLKIQILMILDIFNELDKQEYIINCIINFENFDNFIKENLQLFIKLFHVIENNIEENIENLILNIIWNHLDDFYLSNKLIKNNFLKKFNLINSEEDLYQCFSVYNNFTSCYYLSKIGLFDIDKFFKSINNYFNKELDNELKDILQFLGNMKYYLKELNKREIYFLNDKQIEILDKINIEFKEDSDNKLYNLFENLINKNFDEIIFNKLYNKYTKNDFYLNINVQINYNNYDIIKNYVNIYLEENNKNIIFNLIRILPYLYTNNFENISRILDLIEKNYNQNQFETILLNSIRSHETAIIDFNKEDINFVYQNLFIFTLNNYIIKNKKYDLVDKLKDTTDKLILLNYIKIKLIEKNFSNELLAVLQSNFDVKSIEQIKIKLLILENIKIENQEKKILKFLKVREILLENNFWYYILLYKKLLNNNIFLECMKSLEKLLDSDISHNDTDDCQDNYSYFVENKTNIIKLNDIFFNHNNLIIKYDKSILNEEIYKAKFVLGNLYKYFGKYQNSINLYSNIINNNIKFTLLKLDQNNIKEELSSLILNKNLIYSNIKIHDDNDLIIVNEILMIRCIKNEFKEVFGLLKLIKDKDYINYLSILYLVKEYGLYLKNWNNLNEKFKNNFIDIINKIKDKNLSNDVKELILIINIILELNIKFNNDYYPENSFLNINNKEGIFNDRRKLIYQAIHENNITTKKNYLDILIKFYPNDMKLWILYGNLLLNCDKLNSSLKCFEISYNLIDLSNAEETKILILNLNILKNKCGKLDIQEKCNKILKMLSISFWKNDKKVKDLELLKSNIFISYENRDYKETIQLFKLLLIENINDKNTSISLFLEENYEKIKSTLKNLDIKLSDLKEIYLIISQNPEVFTSDFIKNKYLLNLKIIISLVERYNLEISDLLKNIIKNEDYIQCIININNLLKSNNWVSCKKLCKISFIKYPFLYTFCLSVNNLILNKENKMLKTFNIEKLVVPKTKNNLLSLNYKVNIDSTFRSLNKYFKIHIKKYPQESLKLKKLLENQSFNKLNNYSVEEIKLKYKNDIKITNLLNDVFLDKKNEVNDNVIDTTSYIINLSKNFNKMDENEFEDYLQSLSEVKMDRIEEVYVNYYVFLFYMKYFDKEDREKVEMLTQVYEFLLENENISMDFNIEMKYLKQIYKKFILREFNKRKYNKTLKLCYMRNPVKYRSILTLLNK